MKNPEKNEYTTVRLAAGEVHVYDFGAMKLHAYETGDPIRDEVFILEKDGGGVVLELPCFRESVAALGDYVEKLGLREICRLPSYHMAGAAFLPGTPVFSTREADAYGHSGGGKALIDGFASAFGGAFDASVVTVTDYIEAGPVTLCGVELVIVPDGDAFGVEIPGINAVYTHMLGGDCHSIVAGAGHAQALIAQLEGYLARGFGLVLSSHYTPEDLKDVRTKIAYLRDLESVAAASGSAQAFREAVRERYPAYSGENYLEMTANAFFPGK